MKCYYCDKVEHIMKFCRKFKEDKQNDKKKELEDNNLVEYYDDLVLIPVCSREFTNSNQGSSWWWILEHLVM